ncbi:SDR family oxidoreductase [Bordetella bronchiseptica]|uniref:SDR family oxidoreductase n=1 Tax=Bordetella bronchiseptica TaxID=518 RepID=UPI000460FC27|nr:SDR family oxidoreductase [Bordetella bronchiseptica]KDD10121.1 KR domain protein [Bordetella bronchiseptica MBORD707]
MQHVFITGASSGLGQALARRYAADGARLGLLGRRAQALEALASSLPGQHRCYAVDVRDRAALHAAAQDFIAHCGGRVDVVIASAGVSAGTLTEAGEDYAVFKEIVDTNLLATVATFEPFIAGMRAARAGRLVGIASVAGVRGLPGAGAYSASKAAVATYCESLRLELAQAGVRVVTIAPGYVKTAMTAHNPYAMPFLMEADAFAGRTHAAIARGVSYRVIPWQMGVVAKLMRLLPDAVYDRLARDAPRKPRRGQ